MHGYAAVPQGDLIKIVPDVNAKQGPVPAYTDDQSASDQLVTRVIKVENVPAAQLVPILRPLVPQQGHLAAYAATNTLIVTDRASNIERLSTIISGIDRPDNEEVEIINLRYASAAEIIRILQSLQNRGAQIGTPGQVRFASDDRTNAILLSGEQAARTRMRGIIANLDTPVESGWQHAGGVPALRQRGRSPGDPDRRLRRPGGDRHRWRRGRGVTVVTAAVSRACRPRWMPTACRSRRSPRCRPPR